MTGPAVPPRLEPLRPLLARVVADWELEPEGSPSYGACSLVRPVRTPTGAAAVVKVGLPDEESEHEHLALQRWRGNGAVRLLRADPSRRALLLERLERTDLGSRWDEEACEVVAGLFGRLHVPPMPQLRTQASYVERWAAVLARDASAVPVPRRLVDQTLALARDLAAEPPSAVIHADLHYENVLLGARDGTPTWLAIDPKPMNGDPHYELEPMLRNRFEAYGAAGSARDGIRRRFHALVDAAGFDETRARDWVIVRSILNAHWVREDAAHVTRCITIAKAVQD